MIRGNTKQSVAPQGNGLPKSRSDAGDHRKLSIYLTDQFFPGTAEPALLVRLEHHKDVVLFRPHGILGNLGASGFGHHRFNLRKFVQ